MEDKKLLEDMIVKYGNNISLTQTGYGMVSLTVWTYATAVLNNLEHNRPTDKIGMYGLYNEIARYTFGMDLRTVHSDEKRADIQTDLSKIRRIIDDYMSRNPL